MNDRRIKRTARRKRPLLQFLACFICTLAAVLGAAWLLRPAAGAPPESGSTLLDGLFSSHAILLDAESGAVLAQKGGEEVIYPASLTKIMAALLALEALPDLDAACPVPEDIFPPLWAADASLAGFQPGEQATVRDLLYGTLLPSGAECAVALARAAAGDEAAFVKLMNEKAAALGMEHTRFCNPTGLHDDAHVSTVADLAVLLRAALQNADFTAAFTAQRYRTAPSAVHPEGFTVYSTLFTALEESWQPDGVAILGGKTGYTEKAGHCLASLAEVRGRRCLLVTAGAAEGPNGEPYHVLDACTVYGRLAAQIG